MSRRAAKRVLFITDDDELSLAATGFLRGRGHEPLRGDGVTGSALAAVWHPDVVVIDFAMPGTRAMLAVARLKENALTIDTPLVIVNSAGPLSHIGRSFLFLPASLDLDALTKAIEALLSPTRP